MQENLSLYHVFYTVSRTGNISAAAKELYISQPAISRSIQKLEDNLDTTLFNRSSRGVSLTPDGQLLYKKVKTAFQLLSEGEDSILHNRSREIPRLRIGASTTLCKYVLMPRLKDFISANPQIRITISCQSTYQTLKLLEEDQIDIGLIGRPQKLSRYEFIPLLKIQDTFVATRQYLENLEQLYPEEPFYHTATFMLLDEQNITRQSVNTILHEHQMKLGHILEVSTMDLLIQFAQIGMGIACVIKEFVKKELDMGMLVEAPMGLSFPSREIGFVYRKGNDSQELLAHLKSGFPLENL